MERERVVVAGASGCIGRRLVAALLQEGCHVHAFCRRPDNVTWPDEGPGVLETVALDIANESATAAAITDSGAQAAYYLIHSMGGGISDRDDFVRRDWELATSFARAISQSAVERVIYLGGHQPDGEAQSEHLRSRGEVGEILRRSRATVTELRAGVVIDLESAAFRMLAKIIDKQSTLLIPPQFCALTHPVSIADAIAALITARVLPRERADWSYDIGCREPCRYDDLIRWYAEAHGEDPSMVHVPWAPRSLIVPYVASVTGEDFGLVWALSGSWGVDLPLHDESLYDIFPELPRTPARKAVHQAVESMSGRRTHIQPSSRARAAS